MRKNMIARTDARRLEDLMLKEREAINTSRPTLGQYAARATSSLGMLISANNVKAACRTLSFDWPAPEAATRNLIPGVKREAPNFEPLIAALRENTAAVTLLSERLLASTPTT